MQLVIGNKNYSTWSLRPWLLLTHFGLEFEEVRESLLATGLTERLLRYSPSGRVPVLIDGDLAIWDSLAICEYVSETLLAGAGWPLVVSQRAEARSVSAEMHAGFGALRSEMPMNCRARRRVDASPAALRDIARIDQIWADCRQRFASQGDYLFGDFSVADCMYAPVVMRFKTYAVAVSEPSQQYLQHMLQNPALRLWVAAALQETEVIDEDEAGSPVADT